MNATETVTEAEKVQAMEKVNRLMDRANLAAGRHQVMVQMIEASDGWRFSCGYPNYAAWLAEMEAERDAWELLYDTTMAEVVKLEESK